MNEVVFLRCHCFQALVPVCSGTPAKYKGARTLKNSLGPSLIIDLKENEKKTHYFVIKNRKK